MSTTHETRGTLTARWALKIITAGIFTVPGWLPKVTGAAEPLAEALPGGWTAVYAIAALEILTIFLILTPRTALWGACFAAVMMIGAIGSHVVGPVGLEGDMMGVFIAATLALATSSGAAILEWRKQNLTAPALLFRTMLRQP